MKTIPDWYREIDVLPEFAIPDHRTCKRCGGNRGRVRENVHGQDVVYCASCRTHVYNAPKSETGKPQRTVKSRPDLPDGMRARILQLDGYRCFMCGRGFEHGVFLDVAHAISVHEGQKAGIPIEDLNREGNLFSCCEECNDDTGKLSVDQKLWLRLMLWRVKKGCQ